MQQEFEILQTRNLPLLKDIVSKEMHHSLDPCPICHLHESPHKGTGQGTPKSRGHYASLS